MRFAVVHDHELHHGSKAAPLLFRRGDQGSFHVRWDANADDFGFRDCQGSSCVKNASVLQSVSGPPDDATGIDLYGDAAGECRLPRSRVET